MAFLESKFLKWSLYSWLGKTVFFVSKQENLETMSKEQVANLESQLKIIEEENKTLAVNAKLLTSGMINFI